jgi:ElaB/YqjD/DUF883 family membrane-anchored ribosome-binding protein
MNITLEKVAWDVGILIADVEELLRVTAGKPGEEFAAARARAEESLRRMRRQLSTVGYEISTRARAADRYVHAHPWRSLGMASGVAFLMGRLFRRQSAARKRPEEAPRA